MTKIKICLGSSCFSRGNKNMVKQIKDYLHSKELEDTVDFRGAHCFGMCHLGPVIEIDGEIFEKLNEKKLEQLLEDNLGGE